MRRGVILGAVMLGITASRDVCAAPKQDEKTFWEKLKAGNDLVASAPIAAALDGMWSLFVHYATALTNRTWDAPYPWGTIGHVSTRILYGTTWTWMVAAESLAVYVATGGTFEWLAEATYRSDQMLALDAPACPQPGAYGGCGVGVGDFAYLQVRPVGHRWWFEVGGGWVQQRIYNDQFRTVAESSWVLTPITATHEWKTKIDRPVAARLFAGPGLFFGLHSGHMHETLRGQRELSLRAPWHEMYLLDGGVGPGARIEGRAIFARHFGLEAELIMAPFLLGGPTGDRPSSDIAPLDFEREGMSVWRKATLGMSWSDRTWPFKPTLAVFAAELSERPVYLAGYRGVMLRFDIPLRPPAAGKE